MQRASLCHFPHSGCVPLSAGAHPGGLPPPGEPRTPVSADGACAGMGDRHRRWVGHPQPSSSSGTTLLSVPAGDDLAARSRVSTTLAGLRYAAAARLFGSRSSSTDSSAGTSVGVGMSELLFAFDA